MNYKRYRKLTVQGIEDLNRIEKIKVPEKKKEITQTVFSKKYGKEIKLGIEHSYYSGWYIVSDKWLYSITEDRFQIREGYNRPPKKVKKKTTKFQKSKMWNIGKPNVIFSTGENDLF